MNKGQNVTQWIRKVNMAFDGSGVFNREVSDYVFNAVISETDVNTEMDSFATGLSLCITKDGQQTVTDNIPMSSKKFTGLPVGSAAGDSANLRQIQAGAFRRVGTAGGTKNALTITPAPAIAAYALGQRFTVTIGGTSSDAAATIAVSGLTTKAIEINGAALSASVVLVTAKTYDMEYDGTAFQATRLSTVASTGDVVGPGSATDGAVAAYDGTTGKLLKDGVVLGTVATLDSGTGSGNVPLVGTKSSTETLAGLIERSTSAENVTGTDDTVTPTVAGVKEMIDTHVAVSGGWTFVEKIDASTSSTISLGEGNLNANFDYMIRYDHVKHSQDSNLQGDVGTGGGPTYAGSAIAGCHIQARNTTLIGYTESTVILLDKTGGGATAGEERHGYIIWFDPAAAADTEYQSFNGFDDSGGVASYNTGAGKHESAVAVTGLRLYPSGGNFATGRFILLKRAIT